MIILFFISGGFIVLGDEYKEQRNGETKEKDFVIKEKRLYRRAGVKDARDIYLIACRDQLENKPQKMSSRGFLLGDYEHHPEYLPIIEEAIYENIFYVCESKRKILGFLWGYTAKQWIRERPGMTDFRGAEIHWDNRELAKIGINDILALENFGVVDKIAVDTSLNKKRVAFDLLKSFMKFLLEESCNYIMSEIVISIKKNGVLLPIHNYASEKFHKKIGFRKVGESGWYRYPKSVFGEEGLFRDAVYIASVKDMPYKYKKMIYKFY